MQNCAIQMTDVVKSFKQHQVLKDLNLVVPERSIFAFLGNNGEGKSTAIRLMLGLLHPDQGSIHLLGKDIGKERSWILQQVGCLVEAPSAYPNLTAREFLRIACTVKKLPMTEIDRVLEVVGLASTVLFDKNDPLSSINRRISIVVLNKRSEESLLQEDGKGDAVEVGAGGIDAGKMTPPAAPVPGSKG